MIASWDDNAPDDCDAPESHPDGCACVRPGEEPVQWEWLSLGGVRWPHPPPGVCEELRARPRQMAEAGEAVAMPEGLALEPLPANGRSCEVHIETARAAGEEIERVLLGCAPVRHPVHVLSPEDVAPEHCPLCREAEERRCRMEREKSCPVHGRATEEAL